MGICYGLQLMVIEFARNVCGLAASSAEIDENAKDLVVDILPEQKNITDKGGTMRLGCYEARVLEDTRLYELYGKTLNERHRHRYEVNPQYHHVLEKNGLFFSAISPNGKLVECIELPNHPYFMGCQGHPELKSRLESPAPLFVGLLKACMR